ncbi:MAG: hypothetical protein H7Z17_19985 [Fuerstia sp.]|nr:hypothetical protein [Fuerstiella sp.]
MPPTTTSNLERLALEGPIGLPLAVAIALVLLALFTVSLGMERRILGNRYTAFFWLLRATALGVAVWMLLDPTRVLVEVSTTRKSVAVLMDVSGSMQTIDPEGTSDDLRWAMSQGPSKQFPATQAADQAYAAAGIAEKHLQQASEALVQHQRESLVVETTSAANEAIRSVRDRVGIVAEELKAGGSGETNASAKTLAKQIVKELEGSEFVAFGELCEALKKGRTPSEKGWRESLPDLQNRLTGIRRQLSELARDVAQLDSDRAQNSQPQMMSAIQRSARMSRAAGFLDSLSGTALKTVRDKADVRISTFDQSPTLLTGQANTMDVIKSLLPAADKDSDEQQEVAARSGTDISSVLEQLSRDRRDQPLAAAFILTDVSHNKAGAANPRQVAADMGGTPVYVIPIGNTQYVRDILVQSVFCPTVAMRNDDIVIEAVIQAYDCEGETCLVQLLQDGQPVDSRTVQLDSGFATRRVRFDQKMSDVGVQRFQIAVSPVAKELTEQNNVDDFEVNVTRSEIKLLLADEMPRWEYRYLAQLFRRDPKVELDEMLFHPRPIATGRRSASGTFPVTVDDWDQYDVVILGDLTVEHFPVAAQESLIEYMKERGGTVMLIAGKESMPEAYSKLPIADVLPVTRMGAEANVSDDAGYSFHVTDAGQSHNALMIGETEEATKVAWDFINQFAPLHEVSPWRLPRPSATTLISAVPKGTLDKDHAAKTSAFLCWQPVGRGRVVYLAGPETFRLRFLRGDRLHYRFWGQMLRWALASDLSAGTEVVRIRADKAQYNSDESIQIVVRLTDSSGKPVVTAEELQAIARQGEQEHSAPLVADELIPGQYIGEFKSLPPGDYQIEPTGGPVSQLLQSTQQQPVSASFTVQADLPVEFLDTRCDRALAQQIADITGGQVLPPTAVEEVLRLTNLEPEIAQKMESRPLWLQWKYLWIVFGCLQAEWIVRKVKGLS